jgi:secondary thiamine-phosphate synthase enzyme
LEKEKGLGKIWFAMYAIDINTKGENDIVDITAKVEKAIEEICKKENISDGIAVVFAIGSTCAITTIEYESNLLDDFKSILKKIDSYKFKHLDNGRSHVKASIVGPSLSLVVKDKKPLLGTWQQIVLVEFDTRPRKRTVVIEVVGR